MSTKADLEMYQKPPQNSPKKATNIAQNGYKRPSIKLLQGLKPR